MRKAWYNRSKLKNKYNKNQTNENWINFKKQRNICTSLKRIAKKNYFIEKSKNRESFWKIFGKYITNKGSHAQEDYIVSVDTKLISNEHIVANTFNEHYINIIENYTGQKLEGFTFDNTRNKIDQITEAYKSHPSISLIKEKMLECEDF